MRLQTAPYLEQEVRWPQEGRHILAQFGSDTVTVYQAYRPAIGHFAARQGRFGGEYRFSRMSWIKPNFLWMMFRSGWGTKPDQDVTLALHLKREGFDALLAAAVASSFGASGFGTPGEWAEAVRRSDVRLQWDPDHGPVGEPLRRRALQLGVRGEVLHRLNDEWLLGVDDISAFVQEQRAHVGNLALLHTPREAVYPVQDQEVARKIRIS